MTTTDSSGPTPTTRTTRTMSAVAAATRLVRSASEQTSATKVTASTGIWDALHIPQDVQKSAQTIGQVVGAVSSAISWVGTVQSVLQMAGFISPAPNPYDQLYERIQKDLRTLLTATLAGATEERLRDVAEQGAIARTAAQHANEHILNGRPTDPVSLAKLSSADITSRQTMNVLSDQAWWQRTYDPSTAAVYGQTLPGPKVFEQTGGGSYWDYQNWSQRPSAGLIWDYRHILPVYLRALAARVIVLKALAADGNQFLQPARVVELQGYAEFLQQQHDRIDSAIRVTPAPPPHQGQFPLAIMNCGAVETYSGTHVFGGLHPMYVDPDITGDYAANVEIWDRVVADCRFRLYEGLGLGALRQVISGIRAMLVPPCGVSVATGSSASAALIGCAGVEPASHVFVMGADDKLHIAWRHSRTQPWQWHHAGTPTGARLSRTNFPVATSYGSGGGQRMHGYTTTHSGRLAVYWWTGSGWQWADLGRPGADPTGPLAATAFESGGRQHLRAYSMSKSAWADWWDGTRWQWVDLGRPPGGALDLRIAPAVLSYRWQGRMIDDLYFNSGGRLVEHLWNENGTRSWSTPSAQPTFPKIHGSPAAVVHEENGLPVVQVFAAIDSGGSLGCLEWRGGWRWRDHGRPPGNVVLAASPNGQPVKATVLRLPPGNGWGDVWTVAVVRGINGRLYARIYVSGNEDWYWQDLRTPVGTTVSDVLGVTSYVKSGGFVGVDIYARSADGRVWRTGIGFDNTWDEIGAPA